MIDVSWDGAASPETSPPELDVTPAPEVDVGPTTLDVAPDVVEDPSPDVAVDTAPDVEPDVVEDVVPDAVPDIAPDVPPAPVLLCGDTQVPEAPAGAVVPALDAPIYATILGTPLTLSGVDLGAPGPDRGLVFASGATCLIVASDDPAVTAWSDSSVSLAPPDGLASGTVRVYGGGALGPEVPLELYAYDWVDIPETAGTNAHPLDLVVDAAGRVFVNQEFHLEFHRYDPVDGEVTALAIPKPPPPGPFASTIFSDHRTQTSILGESVILDPAGNVWFTQGGAGLYQGEHPNHSRVVRYDPDAPAEDAWRIYNLPGDWNEAIGVAWDPVRERIWVAEGGLIAGSRLTNFDPEAVPWDNHFDFSTSLDAMICGDDDPDDGACFRRYDHPNPKAHLAHARVAADGAVWFTGYWSDHIGRLFPETGEWELYPVPAATSTDAPVWVVGAGPWQLRIDEPTGDIVFCEFFDSTVNRLPAASFGDPTCLGLDESGENPCIQVMEIPEYDPLDDHIHSIEYDAAGRLWYSTFVDKEAGHIGGSLGFVTADWGHILRLPSMEPFPSGETSGNGGIAIDDATGDIWFAEFFRKRIGRLVLVTP